MCVLSCRLVVKRMYSVDVVAAWCQYNYTSWLSTDILRLRCPYNWLSIAPDAVELHRHLILTTNKVGQSVKY